MSDPVNKPSHYAFSEIECIDYLRAIVPARSFIDHCRMSAIAYITRSPHKGSEVEDIDKAINYLTRARNEAEKAIEAMQGNCPVIPDSSSPKPLAIPAGWRELEPDEVPKANDMHEHEGVWMKRSDDASCEYEWYEVRHIREIETANPSEAPNSSIPDPGEGYRLLSKEPSEPVRKGDEFWQKLKGEWVEIAEFVHETRQQAPSYYYRRKVEPTQWVPKVGDKVRVVGNHPRLCGEICVVSEVYEPPLVSVVSDHDSDMGWVRFEEIELIEAAS